MMPTTVDAWLEVARERTADAEAILETRPHSIGSVYMAGYAIECHLKALLKNWSKPFPKGGQRGHDLRGLWETAGFRLTDINDQGGAKSYFIQNWNTSLRYELTHDSTIESKELVTGAKQLTGWIQQQNRRHHSRNK